MKELNKRSKDLEEELVNKEQEYKEKVVGLEKVFEKLQVTQHELLRS